MSSSQLPISIGIPFYNAEATLLDAIRSVFSQTHQNWELILVDDGSTDCSLELAQSINDPRVRVYSDGKNLRLAARLNQIARLASYDFVARMDADDLISPTRLEKQIAVLLSDPGIDLVSTGICSLSDDYEPVGIRCAAPNHIVSEKGLLSGNSGIVHASLLGRRDWFKRNLYKENMPIAEDTNLWVRAYSKNDLRIAFISEPLYYYREDGNVTKEKLLLAYAMGRRTILSDANKNFSYKCRISSLINNLIKTFLVKFFTRFTLELARSRRNVDSVPVLQKIEIDNEILFIRNTIIPVNNNL